MTYEVCPKCYGTLNPDHKCGPKHLAKDDLCPKCLIVLDDCSKAVFHYARDMLQLERLLRMNEGGLPDRQVVREAVEIFEKREERILKDMEDGRIKRH